MTPGAKNMTLRDKRRHRNGRALRSGACLKWPTLTSPMIGCSSIGEVRHVAILGAQ